MSAQDSLNARLASVAKVFYGYSVSTNFSFSTFHFIRSFTSLGYTTMILKTEYDFANGVYENIAIVKFSKISFAHKTSFTKHVKVNRKEICNKVLVTRRMYKKTSKTVVR